MDERIDFDSTDSSKRNLDSDMAKQINSASLSVMPGNRNKDSKLQLPKYLKLPLHHSHISFANKSLDPVRNPEFNKYVNQINPEF
jgi:hypothetical protein